MRVRGTKQKNVVLIVGDLGDRWPMTNEQGFGYSLTLVHFYYIASEEPAVLFHVM